jgi:uncharacterized protein
MLTMAQLESRRQEILAIAMGHGASHVRVFGSVARGDAGDQSDLDLLVRMEQGRSLLDRIALIQDLEDLLQHPVDVVNEKAIPAPICLRVIQEARLL